MLAGCMCCGFRAPLGFWAILAATSKANESAFLIWCWFRVYIGFRDRASKTGKQYRSVFRVFIWILLPILPILGSLARFLNQVSTLNAIP